MTICEKCNKPISQERIEFFLDHRGEYPTTCKDCSEEKANKAFMDYAHKTAGELVIINSQNSENLRRAERVFRRSR